MKSPSLSRVAVVAWLVLGAQSALAANDTAVHLANVDASHTAYIQVPDHPDFWLQQFTLEAWIQRTGSGYGFSTDPSGAAIIAKPFQGTSGSNISSWHLHWTPNGEIHFNLTHTQYSSGVYLLSSAVSTPNARHHVAVTFDGATIKEYIDGVLKGQAAWNLGTVYYNGAQVLIGADNFSFGYLRGFDGWIDDVRIWNYARTVAEINAAKDCRLAGTEAGLVAYWPFDDSNLVDATGHLHDGGAVQAGNALTYGGLVSIPTCTSDVPVPSAGSGFAFAAYPQPTRDRVTLSFELPAAGAVTVDAIDLAGRKLATLAAREYAAGRHEVEFDRASLGAMRGGAGLVFVRLRYGATTVTRPVVMLR